MKTAVSLPDELFEEAEELARRTGKSRSELFRDALREYLGRHSPDAVTQSMNEALNRIGDSSDDFASVAAVATLHDTEW